MRQRRVEEEEEEVLPRNDLRRNGGVKVIAQNAENFISFQVAITKRLGAHFIDSYRFLQSSLAELAGNLSDEQMNTHPVILAVNYSSWLVVRAFSPMNLSRAFQITM